MGQKGEGAPVKIMGLDFGTKRIGVAMSDEMFLMAHSVNYIARKDPGRDFETINHLVRENSICEIVVGLPLNMNGTYSQKTKEAVEFADDLAKAVSIPVKTWDERLTSVQAERALLEADMSRGKRRQLSDKLAAQFILQSYLDSRKKDNKNA